MEGCKSEVIQDGPARAQWFSIHVTMGRGMSVFVFVISLKHVSEKWARVEFTTWQDFFFASWNSGIHLFPRSMFIRIVCKCKRETSTLDCRHFRTQFFRSWGCNSAIDSVLTTGERWWWWWWWLMMMMTTLTLTLKLEKNNIWTKVILWTWWEGEFGSPALHVLMMATAVLKKVQIESPHKPPSIVKHAEGRGYIYIFQLLYNDIPRLPWLPRYGEVVCHTCWIARRSLGLRI